MHSTKGGEFKMKKLVLSGGILFSKCDDSYIVSSTFSDDYCLVDADGYFLLQSLLLPDDGYPKDLYEQYRNFWDSLISAHLVTVIDSNKDNTSEL